MKEQKRSFRQKAEDFLSGRGFYIALSACVLVIGISAWTLLATESLADRTDVASDSITTGVVEKDTAHDTITVPIIDKSKNVSDDTVNSDSQTDSEKADDTDTMSSDNYSEDQSVDTSVYEDNEPDVSAPVSFAWPVFGEIDVGYFKDELVYNQTMMDWRTHSAIDIAADLGAKVMSVAEGTVTDIYEDALWGTVVVIDHGDGLESIYANLAAVPTVSIGDYVTSASVIGAVGDTAIGETGQPYHLHFSMKKDGESIDPTDYLP